MKILHLISSLDAKSGGTSWACAKMCQAQADHGDLSISIAYTYGPGDDPEVVEWLSAGETPISLYPIGPTSAPLRRHSALKKTMQSLVSRHDVIHVHGLWEEIQWVGHRLASQLCKPVVLSPHGMLSPWSLGHSKLKKRVYWLCRWGRQIAKTTCIHTLTRSEASQLCWVDGGAQRVEPLGIDFPQEVHSKSRVNDESIQLLFLSRLHPGKNLHFLLQVLAQIRDKAWRLTVAGGGAPDYIEKIVALIQQLQLGDRVELVGQVNATQREELLRRSHLMLLPSEHENFGIVVLEALSRQVEVLLSPEVGLAEDLQHSKHVQVQPIDREAWERCLRQKIDQFRLGLGVTGRDFEHDWGGTRFDWRQIGKNWGSIYRELVERNHESKGSR